LIFTTIVFLATLRSSLALASMFLTLWVTFLLLTIGYYQETVSLIKAGGSVGVAVSFED